MEKGKKQITPVIIFILLSSILLFSASTSLATSIYEQTNAGAEAAIKNAYGGVDTSIVPGEKDPFMDVLIRIINYLLSFVGLIFFLLLIYAGYLWMDARGNNEQVEKAKKMTREVVIGLIIIILARLITEFVLTQFLTALNA